MLRVALTGGIGAGKSSVAQLLAESGAVIVDADAIAREVVETGQPALAEIVERFGADVLDPGGALDRAALADIVFKDESARADLNAIVHPRVGAESARRLAAADDDAIVVYDVPLLLESGGARGWDAIVVVVADQDVRLQRLVTDRGMSPDEVRARISSQASEDDLRAIADFVVDNSGDRNALKSAVGDVWDALVRSVKVL